MNFTRVHPGEWIVSACGLLILVGLSLPWYGDETGLESVSLLDLLVTVVAVAGLILPMLVAVTRRTNIPVVFETFLSTLALLVTVLLALKLIWTPDGGLESGFFVGLFGILLLTWAGWRSTSREN